MGPSVTDWVPPETFDEYRLVKALGRGGMGQVWLAHDGLLDRMVAVKFIANLLDRSDVARQRFLTEARAAARIQHPNILTVFRIGELGPRPYLISEFLRGDSLDKLARPVAWPHILDLGLGLARGLAAAHRRGVLHRDLKPANAILTESGEVKLLDFGLAKLTEGLELLPASRAARGTPSGQDDTVIPDGGTLDATAPPRAAPPTEPVVRRGRRSTAPPIVIAAAPPTVLAASPSPARSPVTVVGAMMGTPAYMSPEAWRGEPATPRGDVYSLGVLLYELATGAPPHRGGSSEVLRALALDVDAEPLAGRAPGLDARFAAVVDRCLRRDPAARFASGEEVRDALEAIAAARAGGELPAGNPYRGLAAFEAEHRRLFFGRDGAIRTVIERLAVDPFVLVAGDSGVGKSSLCRAGAIPRIEDGALGERRFQIVRLVPGRRPAAVLAAALAPVLGADEAEVARAIAADADEVARRLRATLGGSDGLLLFVDQLEELVTLAEPDEAERASRLLAAIAVRSPGLRLLATVRGDYVTRLARLPALAPELERALLLLAPLGADAIREAVLGPARATGVRFERDALVDELVGAATGGGLPLLQFALGELWEARDRATETITQASLDALGGVAGALSRHADATLAAMPPAQRAAARGLLLGFVTADGTRARRSDGEVASGPDAAAALAALVRARLVVAREDGGDAAYEIAHEALIERWPALRDWLVEDADRRALREQLARAAADWAGQGRARDALWSARRLAAASDLDEAALGETARAYLAASRRAVRARRLALVAALVAVPLLGVGVYALTQRAERQELDRRVRHELTDARAALASARALRTRLDAARATAFATFDADDRPGGEAAWKAALATEAETDQAYGHASQAAEKAVVLDGGRADVKDVLADIIYERALLAELGRETSQTREHLERLALYDRGGVRRARWDAPGAVALALQPDDARADIERWTGARWEAVASARAHGESALPQGSYRVIARAPEHAELVHPFTIARGERVELAVALPDARTIPPDFVYLPRARFLTGSPAPEDQRASYYLAAPLHARTLAQPALIARHETTLAEWIVFLEAQADPARFEALRPRTGSLTMQGSVELRRDGGRWIWRMQPSSIVHEVADGERVRYAEREVDVEHDWRKFPVSGVSWDDATTYVAWLRTTGRVPGARLCAEAEWELAARGADGRVYPTGDELADGAANTQEKHGRKAAAYGPDQVSSNPESASPFGVEDLAGNVFELTGARSDRGLTVARGGAFPVDRIAARTDLRQEVETSLRDPSLGFRVCADVRAPQH